MDIIKLTERDIEKNDKIAEELKADIKETFSDMLEFLGKENFLRWVRKQDISKVARQTIYQVCTDEQDEYLKEHSSVLGYHQSPSWNNGNQRKIVFKRDVGEGKGVRSHETWHALANGLGGYSRFFGEGITEYLSKVLYNKTNYSYKENVDVVGLMVDMYGNSVIREYLTGDGDNFFRNIASKVNKSSLASKDGLDINEMISNMEKEFKTYHDSTYEYDDSGNPKRSLIEGKKLFMETYFAYERSKIDSLEYYKDGKVDFTKYNKQLNKVINRAFSIGIPEKGLITRYKELTSDLIESSHLLEGLSGEERESAKKQILKQVYEQFNELVDGKEPKDINQEVEPFKSLNKDSALKLAEKKMSTTNFFDRKGRFEYIKYFNQLAVLRDKMGMSDYVFNAIVAKTNLEMAENPKLFDSFSRSVLGMHSEIVRLEEERKNELSNVRIKKAEIQSIDGTAFLEKKDDEYQLLVVNSETGKIDTLPLNRNKGSITPIKGVYTDVERKHSIQGNGYPKEVIEDLEQGNLVFKVQNIYRQRVGSYISINENNGEATFINQNSLYTTRENVEHWKKGFEDMKDAIVSETLLEGFSRKINRGDYSEFTIGENRYTTERVNFGPNHIKFDEFMGDYMAITRFLPIDRNHKYLRELTARLVERTHNINTIPIRSDDDKVENPDPTKPTHRQRFEEAKLDYDDYRKEIVTSVVRSVELMEKGDLTDRQIKMLDRYKNNMDDYEVYMNDLVAALKPKQSKALYFLDDIIDESKKKTATSDFASLVIDMEKSKTEKTVDEEQK